MRTSATLMKSSQSALFFDLTFQLLILHLLCLSVCLYILPTPFIDTNLTRISWVFLLSIWLSFLLLSILLT
jgi:hypothetical protein